MPRPRSTPGSTPLSPGQAAYVLERLMSERRISPAEINRYVGDMTSEINELEQRLQRLREAQGGGGAAASGGAASGARRGPGRPAAGRGGRRRGRPAAAQSEATAEAKPAAAGAKKGGRRGRAKSSITPEQLASRQLQGRYLALVRQFPERKRAEYARIAKERGREVAIEEMQKARK